jgi:hypothetical protein
MSASRTPNPAPLEPDAIANRGRQLYARHRGELEAKFLGKWIRFNLPTGAYAIGDTSVACEDAYDAAFAGGPSWGTQIGWHGLR